MIFHDDCWHMITAGHMMTAGHIFDLKVGKRKVCLVDMASLANHWPISELSLCWLLSLVSWLYCGFWHNHFINMAKLWHDKDLPARKKVSFQVRIIWKRRLLKDFCIKVMREKEQILAPLCSHVDPLVRHTDNICQMVYQPYYRGVVYPRYPTSVTWCTTILTSADLFLCKRANNISARKIGWEISFRKPKSLDSQCHTI